jgi:hypothetical protein
MPTLRKTVLGLAAAAATLGGNAAAADDAKPERLCINRREINAISALDEGHAFAKLGAERFYMLTVDKSCRGLELARRLVLDASRSRICGDGTTLLSFEEPSVGLMRCRIERIDKVKDKNAALDLIESRVEPKN